MKSAVDAVGSALLDADGFHEPAAEGPTEITADEVGHRFVRVAGHKPAATDANFGLACARPIHEQDVRFGEFRERRQFGSGRALGGLPAAEKAFCQRQRTVGWQ